MIPTVITASLQRRGSLVGVPSTRVLKNWPANTPQVNLVNQPCYWVMSICVMQKPHQLVFTGSTGSCHNNKRICLHTLSLSILLHCFTHSNNLYVSHSICVLLDPTYNYTSIQHLYNSHYIVSLQSTIRLHYNLISMQYSILNY